MCVFFFSSTKIYTKFCPGLVGPKGKGDNEEGFWEYERKILFVVFNSDFDFRLTMLYGILSTNLRKKTLHVYNLLTEIAHSFQNKYRQKEVRLGAGKYHFVSLLKINLCVWRKTKGNIGEIIWKVDKICFGFLDYGIFNKF